jgi:hypothetical protein
VVLEMTSLLDRFTGTDEPEEIRVSTPRPYAPGVPWWSGVYGLDPAIPVDDWAVAARYTALACAVHVVGLDAVYRTTMLPTRKGAPVAFRFRMWLLEAKEPEGAARRRFALRLACEHARDLDMDDLLRVAQDLYAALTQD